MDGAIENFLITAQASAVAGATIALLATLIQWLRAKRSRSSPTYTERLRDLIDSPAKASKEADEILNEVVRVAHDRESAVQKLETDLHGLEAREKELKEQVEALEKTPIPVAEYFGKLLEQEQRRNAKRDYKLFAAGVGATVVLTIVVQLVVWLTIR